MAKVHVGVGSNIEREKNIRLAITSMRRRFGTLDTSQIYETESVGFVGDPFYNLVATFHSDLSPAMLVHALREIENGNERNRNAPRMASRTLDLDLLLYDDLVLYQNGLRIPREDITQHAFVLRPLADIAGTTRHPITGKTFSELWRAFDASEQPTRRVHMPFN